MSTLRAWCLRFAIATALATLVLATSPPAEAETKRCTEITEVPYRITAPGHYCLHRDLQLASTASSPKNAILIEGASHVVVDCNGHTITGPGGADSGAGVVSFGVYFPKIRPTNNIVVRNCRLSAVRPGISLDGRGHVVEDNHVDGAMGTGIQVWGLDGVVRRNRVSNTVGWTGTGSLVTGIIVTGGIDVLDNSIDGVTAAAGSDDDVHGIHMFSHPNAVIAGNRIRHLVKDHFGEAHGIYLDKPERASIHGNRLSNPEGAVGGVFCDDPQEPGFEHYPAIASDNIFNGYLGGVVGCVDGGDNVMQ